MLQEFLHNFSHNLFKPLLLFFYAGFLIPILRVKFEFPKVIYQGLTIYLLLAIGWHGGEELASLKRAEFGHAFGFMLIGFCTNFIVGILAYVILRNCTRLRQIDAATVAGYYGSDSAGTFVTAVGVLTASHVAFAAYMPVLLAVMEIPGCLVALYIVSKMREKGLNAAGYMPGEVGYRVMAAAKKSFAADEPGEDAEDQDGVYGEEQMDSDAQMSTVQAGSRAVNTRGHSSSATMSKGRGRGAYRSGELTDAERCAAEESEADMALEPNDPPEPAPKGGFLNPKLLHEVFLNPGIYLLFAGITIGFISRLQGEKIIAANDVVFVNMFQGLLCLFLLEMGMTASRRLRDLRQAGWQFVAFGLLAPNLFASIGIGVAHCYSLFIGHPFDLGTYVLFAVLCGAASYIALPAVQRMAIPEASPTLPLAASLGLTFSYNVTVGIPLYLMMATALTSYFPVHSI